MFAFDKVLKPNVSQEYVYNVAAKPIVAGKLLVFHSYAVETFVLPVGDIELLMENGLIFVNLLLFK